MYNNYNNYGASGWDLVPHKDFWRESPYIARDAATHIWQTVSGNRGGGGFGGPAEEVHTSPSEEDRRCDRKRNQFYKLSTRFWPLQLFTLTFRTLQSHLAKSAIGSHLST